MNAYTPKKKRKINNPKINTKMWNKIINIALAVDFTIVVDEWQSSLLDFAWTEVRVQARPLHSLMRKYALR